MDQEPIRLLLVDLPPGASAHDLAHALPLGSAAAVTKRLAELLPGTTFEPDGRGTFRRGHYQIDFTVSGDEPSRIEVAVDRAEALVALQRVVSKTGWVAVDPFLGAFVNLESSAASGVVVTVAPVAVAAEPVEEDTPSWRRWLGRAALLIFVIGTTWFAWTWSQRAPVTPIPEAGVAKPELLKDLNLPPELASAIATAMQQPDANAPEEVKEAFLRQADQLRKRFDQMKYLAPALRGDPIVYQMLDYQTAASGFPSVIGGGGFMSPERLADVELFKRMNFEPKLPPSFARPDRDGYAFRFAGTDCTKQSPYVSFLDGLCESFVYTAVPLPGSPGERPAPQRTYALYSSDWRIHYREDGRVPSESDPSVENTAPTTAADLPGGAPEPAPVTPQPGQTPEDDVMASLMRTLRDATDKALGPGGVKKATTELHESEAVTDLRTMVSAEVAFSQVYGQGRYAAPEQLSDAGLFRPLKVPPMLPERFRQPQRLGYVFEFIGERPEAPGGPLGSFGQLYGSYIYVARPMEPGPAGRRTFALYPDGVIFTTTDGRLPTRNDPPLR